MKSFLLLLFISCSNTLVVGADTTLEMVHVIFRHGDRTPDKWLMTRYPNYEEVNNTWPPFGIGQMTNEGILHMFKLGEALRTKYIDILDIYNKLGYPVEEMVKTYVTDTIRTQKSALAFLAGLLPPAPSQQWGKENHCDEKIENCKEPAIATLWWPNTYIYDQSIHDMITRWCYCPAFQEEVLRVQALPEMKAKFSKYDKLHNIIAEKMGKSFDRLEIWDIGDLYATQEAAGVAKPKWVHDIWSELIEYTNLVHESLFYNDKLKRFGAGEILDKILKDSQAKANGVVNDVKMFVYSGHDSIVLPLYVALAGENGFDVLRGFNFPMDFTATILVELHRSVSTGQYVVKLLYSNGDRKFKSLRRMDCADPCPLEDFVRLTRPITFNSANIEAECQITQKGN